MIHDLVLLLGLAVLLGAGCTVLAAYLRAWPTLIREDAHAIAVFTWLGAMVTAVSLVTL